MAINTHPLSWSPDSDDQSSDFALTQGAYIVQFFNPLCDNNPGTSGEVPIDGQTDDDDTCPRGFTLFGVQSVTGLKKEAPTYDTVMDYGANYQYSLPRRVNKPITLKMSFVVTARLTDIASDGTGGSWRVTTNIKLMELWHKYSLGIVVSSATGGSTISEIAGLEEQINFGYGPLADYDSIAYCRIIKLMELRSRDQRLNSFGGFSSENALRWTMYGAKIVSIDYGTLSVDSMESANASLLFTIEVQGFLDTEA